MPQSLILNLETQSEISQQHLQGYSLQQLFFKLVDMVDPELGHVLRRDKNSRAYSLSAIQYRSGTHDGFERLPASIQRISTQPDTKTDTPLDTKPGAKLETQRWRDKPRSAQKVRLLTSKRDSRDAAHELQYSHAAPVTPGAICWWRISFLDDELFDHLIFLWNQLQDESFALGSGSIKILSVLGSASELSWASSRSYIDIYECASAQIRDIHFQFVTPTAFELYGTKTALPSVDAVFQSLRKCWNRYGGLAFAPSIVDSVVPTNFDIQTQTVQNFRRRSIDTLVGCVGQISFRICSEGDPLIVKRINALTDFSQYCPVGLNTQMGMGVIRKLADVPASENPSPSDFSHSFGW